MPACTEGGGATDPAMGLLAGAGALLGPPRRRLAALDDRMPEGVGLESDAARGEAARPIRDVPARWRR